MTVGQLKQILQRSGLSDDAPIYLAVVAPETRDGSREVFASQIECSTSDGLTVYVDTDTDGPPVLVDFGPTAQKEIFGND